ncbi:hypothetical protein [Candidatus Spongiihabitans sp.]|uniref:hypothetical protein n=1 Tax=Candidatus Spongiihabitans sp. TaxID=3101308 RepID=UPI003C7982D1
MHSILFIMEFWRFFAHCGAPRRRSRVPFIAAKPPPFARLRRVSILAGRDVIVQFAPNSSLPGLFRAIQLLNQRR